MSMKPNILLITVDQLRRDGLGCYGDPVTRTPAFDAVAAAGTRYTNCISNHPVCSPWRATLQTGHYAWRHGVEINNRRIDTTLPSLADAFNNAGYHTAFYGKAHWWDSGKPGFYPEEARLRYREWWGFNRGHYHWDTPDFDADGQETHRYAGRYEPEVQTDRAIEFCKREWDRPWLLQLNWGPPHNASMDQDYNDPATRDRMRAVNHARGWQIPAEVMDHVAPDDSRPVSEFPQSLTGRLLPEPYLGMYPEQAFADRPDIPAEHADRLRAMRREYSAMTTSIDDQLARLVHTLEVTGQRANTIIIITADHGDHLGAHGHARGKASPLQAAWRTPLLIAGPGVQPQMIDDQLVSAIDLLPTVCGLAGVKAPDGLPGRDIHHANSQADHDSVLLGLGQWRCLVTERYSYAIERDGDHWRTRHLIDHLRDPWDLDDRQADEPKRCQALHQQLAAQARAAADPLFAGVA